MTEPYFLDPDETPVGRVRVDQIHPDGDEGIVTFSYTLLFIGATDEDVWRMLAHEISLLAELGITPDDIDGAAFVAGIIGTAAAQEVAVVPMPPAVEADLLIISYLSGGVDLLLGSPTPWDPNIFVLRFGEQNDE